MVRFRELWMIALKIIVLSRRTGLKRSNLPNRTTPRLVEDLSSRSVQHADRDAVMGEVEADVAEGSADFVFRTAG